MFNDSSAYDAGDGPVSDPVRPKLTRKQRRAAKREYDAARYQERLAGPLCLRCPRPKAPDSSYCAECGPTVLAAARAQSKARRKHLADAGCCITCGQTKRKTVVPLPQITTPARWHTEGRRAQVRQVTEGDGRTRNRGVGQPRRGRMSRVAEDEQDARLVQGVMERALQKLAHASSPAVQQLGAITRKAAMDDALAELHMAERLCRQILQRHKYVP